MKPLLLFVALFLAGGTASASSNIDQQINVLANQISDATFRLNGKFEYYYSGTPQYRTLANCVKNLQTAAVRIQQLAGNGPWEARSLRGQVENMAGEVARIHDFLDRADNQGYRARNYNDPVHSELATLERLIASLRYHVDLRIEQQNQAVQYGHWTPRPGHDYSNSQPGFFGGQSGSQQPSSPPAQTRPAPQPSPQWPSTSNQWQDQRNRGSDRPRFPVPPDPREVFRSIFGR